MNIISCFVDICLIVFPSILFQVLNETFGKDAFLMNGLVQGVKVCIFCLFDINICTRDVNETRETRDSKKFLGIEIYISRLREFETVH